MVTVVTYRNLFYRASNLYEFVAYRTKSVCKNPYNTSKYLVL